MNTEKTAMQELIGWCVINAFNVEGQDGTKYVAIDYEEMQSQLDYFVEKERQQHINTYRAGDGNAYPKKHDADFAEDYFNETFKK